ncbi:MAG: hypothetical protein E1N59_1372 [Puniceicoccaceae bacterium 5H]|nr:MAG: hypothetical protein E1N59_1372 [Puniceicoccaceae bacterium 5H]
MKLQNLQNLLIQRLRNHWDCEDKMSDTIPALRTVANSNTLALALAHYEDLSMKNLRRLTTCFEKLDTVQIGGRCIPSEAFMIEVEELVSSEGDPKVKDRGIVSLVSALSQLKQALYSATQSIAEELDQPEVAERLRFAAEDELAALEEFQRLAVRAEARLEPAAIPA